MWVAFALQKLLTFFSKKFQHVCVSLDVNFNESLTNDIVSFEQLGPGLLLYSWQQLLRAEVDAAALLFIFNQKVWIFFLFLHENMLWYIIWSTKQTC